VATSTSNGLQYSSKTRKQHSDRLGQASGRSSAAAPLSCGLSAAEARSSSLCAKKSDSAVARQTGPPSKTVIGAVAAAAQLRGIGPAAVNRVAFASTSRAWDDERCCKPYISAYGSERPIDWGVERAPADAPNLDVRWVFSVRRKCSPLFVRQPQKGASKSSPRSRLTEEYGGGY